VRITADLACMVSADIVVLAVPSQYLRGVLRKGLGFYRKGCPVVSVVKGIENKTLRRMSEVVCEEWGRAPVVVLSGPTIAQEVARGIPTTVAVASRNKPLLLKVQDLFMTKTLRVYTNQDIVGVELAGSLKNIIAIACGISDGLGFGTNTKAAIVSRGLAEMARLGVSLGAKKETFSGVAGLGDLVTTCFNPLSRNHYVGAQIARGASLASVLKKMKMVAEGVATAKSAQMLARKRGVEMPIVSEIARVLFNKKSPKLAVQHLMSREKKSE
jgi:glycerol-3-phosphate dehydrogenase (NAD(P)+)